MLVLLCCSGFLKGWKFHVAPMQGYTNSSLRKLFSLLSEEAVLWTEMEKVSDLLDDRAMEKRLHDENDRYTVLQFGGSCPESLRACVERVNSAYSFQEYNLNFGCPSIQSGGADYGAYLMTQPELSCALVRTLKEAAPHVPISVKCRIGVHDRYDSYDDSADYYHTLHGYVSALAGAGVDHVVVHARVAVLQGLSPLKNRSVPSLQPDLVRAVARDFPHLRFTLNGGI
ncbi:tRNA-dihydrouridine synthase, partial [Ochromonadaceae sp. CCMP2298]